MSYRCRNAPLRSSGMRALFPSSELCHHGRLIIRARAAWIMRALLHDDLRHDARVELWAGTTGQRLSRLIPAPPVGIPAQTRSRRTLMTKWNWKRYVVGPNADGKSAVLLHEATNVQHNPGIFYRATLWSARRSLSATLLVLPGSSRAWRRKRLVGCGGMELSRSITASRTR